MSITKIDRIIEEKLDLLYEEKYKLRKPEWKRLYRIFVPSEALQL